MEKQQSLKEHIKYSTLSFPIVILLCFFPGMGSQQYWRNKNNNKKNAFVTTNRHVLIADPNQGMVPDPVYDHQNVWACEHFL